MDEYFIMSLGSKTLKKLEELKIDDKNKQLLFKKEIGNYCWLDEIEFKIKIDNLIRLHNKIDGEFTQGDLGKLRNYTNAGIEYAIFSRKPEYKIGPCSFRVYPILKEEKT